MEKLRIWWIPQVPSNNPFTVDVQDLAEAKKLLNTLADYDKYQLENNIKPDYSNVGGLEFFDGDEWCEFYDEEGNDIWDIIVNKICSNCNRIHLSEIEKCTCGCEKFDEIR